MWYFKNGIMKEFDTNARAGVKINIYLNGRYIWFANLGTREGEGRAEGKPANYQEPEDKIG